MRNTVLLATALIVAACANVTKEDVCLGSTVATVATGMTTTPAWLTTAVATINAAACKP